MVDNKFGEQGSDKEGTGHASGSAGGGAGVVPSYYEMIGADGEDDPEIYERALFEQRIAVKAKGYDVTALSKRQKMRNQLDGPSADGPSGSSLNVEAHPELPEMGGDVDPNTIVLPDNEIESRAGNDPQLQNRLRARMAAKMGMGSGLSMEALRQEMEKKYKQRIQPRMDGPAPAPRFTPPKFRPPGM